MVTYKLVFCDFDDTLVRSGDAVGDYTRRAIADYRAAGGTFVICTGRSRASLEKQLHSVYGDASGIPYICFQGGTIVDGDGKVIRRLVTDRADVVRFSDIAAERGYAHAFHAGGEVYCETKTAETEDYAQKTGCPITYVSPSEHFARTYEGDFDKMMILSSSQTRPGLDEIAAMPSGGSKLMFSGPTYLELVPSGSGKGGAVEFMTKRLGFTRADTVAFGDANNDADMLRSVGLPIAMRGGMKDALDAAKLIAPPASEEGMAFALRMFIR